MLESMGLGKICFATQNKKAPEVRHIRSPWSSQSGGQGSRASIRYGSAAGAA